MSIRPITHNPDGSMDIFFDELGHTGTLTLADISWAVAPDGTTNHSFVSINCPDGCGSTTSHPVSGGEFKLDIQTMFVNKTAADGCTCGNIPADQTSSLPESHVRLNCNRLDGPGIWRLDQSPGVELFKAGLLENAPDMFQVVYRKTDNLIVGLEPSGGVGPDNSVGVIHDMNEYDNLIKYDPAYLSADGDHIVGEPPA